MPPSESFILLCSHPAHYLKIEFKTNHLQIMDDAISLYGSTYYCPSIVYNNYKHFHAIKNITIANVTQKTGGTFDNDSAYPLNLFCLDKWFVSLINWVQNSN